MPDSDGCVIVPAFSGLFAPRWRPDARGVICGLTRFHTKAHLARAALEATAYATRELVDAMSADAGVALPALRVDGGMTANDLLLQIQADVLGLPVVRPAVIETTALGAAYAAGLAVGFWESLDELRGIERGERSWTPTTTAEERERGYARLERGGRALARLGLSPARPSPLESCARAGRGPANRDRGGRMDDSQRKLAAEFVGTFALIFFGAGAALAGRRPRRAGARERPRDRADGDRGRAHLGRALQSGRDALDARHRVASRRREAVRYWVSQLAGAAAAALVLLAIFPSAVTDAANLGVPAVGGHGISTGNALVAEIVTTFFLVFVIYGVAVDKRGAFSILAGLPIGLTISISVLAVGGVSGAALNPARWFGPALVSGTFDNFWVWIVGPAIGAVLAGLAYDRILLRGTPGE